MSGPGDDGTRDGETRDNETRDDATREGETRDNETRDGETRDNETRDDATREGETRDDGTREGQTREGEDSLEAELREAVHVSEVPLPWPPAAAPVDTARARAKDDAAAKTVAAVPGAASAPRSRLRLLLVSSLVSATLLLLGSTARHAWRKRAHADDERAAGERAARTRETAAMDAQALANARALVDHDPTRAVAWLERLRLDESVPAARLLAAAAGARGVAERVLAPADDVALLAWLPDDSIIAAGHDGEIVRWQRGARASLGRTGGAPQLLAGDWRALAAVGSDGRVHLWRLEPPAPLELAAPSTRTLVVAAGSLLTAGDDGSVRKWSPETGFLLSTLTPAAPEGLRNLVAARDGRTVAALTAAADSARALMWRDERARALPRTPPLTALALAPDGERLALGSAKEILLFAIDTGEQTRLLTPAPPRSLLFSADDHRLAQVSSDGSVLLWDLDQRGAQPLVVAPRGQAALSVAFAPDGRTLALARGATLQLWSTRPGLVRTRLVQARELTAIAFAPDGAHVVSAAADRALRVWSLTAGPRDARITLPCDGKLALAAAPIAACAGRVALTFSDGRPALPVAAKALAWDAAGDALAFIDERGALHVADPAGVRTIAPPPRSPVALAFAAARTLIAADAAGALYSAAVDGGSWRAEGRVPVSSSGVCALAASPRWIAISSTAGVTAIDRATGKLQPLAPGDDGGELAFADVDVLVLASRQGGLRLIDLAHATSVTLENGGAVSALAAAPGFGVAALYPDGIVRRWPALLPRDHAAFAAALAAMTSAQPDDPE